MPNAFAVALATSVMPLVADLDGSWTYHVTNHARAEVTVRTANACSTGPNDMRNAFDIAPGGSVLFDCDANTAADERAIVVYRSRTVLCTIHQRTDDRVIVDQTADVCAADLQGSSQVTRIEITVSDPPQ